MASIGWLHLTDLHRGLTQQSWLWPNMRGLLFDDLSKLHDRCGPWSVVLFTGDLTQKGSAKEFEALDETLDELFAHLKSLGSNAVLLAVPGNHDLVRPRSKSAELRLLLQWSDPEMREEFWDRPTSSYRRLVKKAFAPFSDWANRRGLPQSPKAVLPGDFATTLECDGLRLGVVGLNTAAFQLAGGDFTGKLHLHPRQITEVCDGDPLKWAKSHHVNFLMTHHPPVWLDPASQQHLREDIAPAGRFVAHLFGHMHEPIVREESIGGSAARRELQGASLFGLETWGDKEARIHGYTAGRIEIDGAAGRLVLWPRRADRLQASHRKMMRDQSYELADDDSVTLSFSSKLSAPPPRREGRGSFAAFISEKTHDFVGREYVFDAFAAFCERNRSGYFVVQGDPGEGKSTLLAEYARRTGCVVHFNQMNANVTGVSRFLESLYSQLAERGGIALSPPGPGDAADGTYLRRLIELASERAGGARLVIAIDALDEVEMGDARRANVLFLPRVVPAGTYFLVTRRPGDLPLVVDAQIECYDLRNHSAESRRDIMTYVRRAAERPKLQEWIRSREPKLDVEEFVSVLTDRSENNFMYLRYVLPAIEGGEYQSLDLKHLPTGLQGYYEDHWSRMGMRADPPPRTKINVLYTLSEVLQPVSRDLVAEIVREDPLIVQRVLDEWDGFLHEARVDGQTRYSLYHASFRDFLRRKDVLLSSKVTREEINAMIANDLGRMLGL